MVANRARRSPLWIWSVRLIPPAIALGILVWMLNRIGWGEVGAVALTLGPTGVAALVVIGVGESYFDAQSLRQGIVERVPRLAAFACNAMGALVNSLIPWEAGEALKIALISRHAKPGEVMAGVVVWNYTFKWTRPAVALVAAVVGALLSTPVSTRAVVAVIAACVLSMAPYVFLRAVLASGAALRFTAWALARLLSPERAERFQRRIAAVHEGVREFGANHPNPFRWLIAHQLAARVTAWMTLVLAARMMALGYSFAQCSLIYAALSVASYVTVVVPARVGVTEGAAFVVFELLGLPGEQGLLLALVLRLKALLANGIGGLVAVVAPRNP
jgi:hypothetical protein